MTPVMVIIIEPELEFDEVALGEAPTSIGGGLSLLAGSAGLKIKASEDTRRHFKNSVGTLSKTMNVLMECVSFM